MLAKQLYRNFFSFSRLFTWGQTTYGWGRPINEDYFSPGLVEGFKNIKKVDTGKYHIGFITEAN